MKCGRENLGIKQNRHIVCKTSISFIFMQILWPPSLPWSPPSLWLACCRRHAIRKSISTDRNECICPWILENDKWKQSKHLQHSLVNHKEIIKCCNCSILANWEHPQRLHLLSPNKNAESVIDERTCFVHLNCLWKCWNPEMH